MPATAGRVRMPANNRVHSSAALQTHGIWQSAIGYDPYAPSKDEDKKSSNQKPSSAADPENAYASFQGLLALARITGSNADETRGACKRCGRVGHLTFQCRNFVSVKDDNKDKDAEAIEAAVLSGLEKIKGHGSKMKGKAENEDSSEEEEESESSDSDYDSEMERAIAEKYGKKVSRKLKSSSKKHKKKDSDSDDESDSGKRKKRGRSKRRRSGKKRGHSDSEDDDEDKERRKRRREKRRKRDESSDEEEDRRRRRKSRKEKRRRRSHKGTLSDGAVIAVKQLSSKSKQGKREFVNEIGMISSLHHPNLVQLYGCCAERNHLLLVYEYMENNSLARALFGPEEHRLKIDWPTRQKICIGIAKGLSFLHEESSLKIVHRDIKATNVLLDKKLNPKISDFGLARLDDDDNNTHITTRVAGTIGYMAPEYALWGYLTYKADVYSFGVLALEIAAGKSNMTYRPNEKFVCLLDWALVLQRQGKLKEVVDATLGSDLNEDEALRMLNVALLCTSPSPALRPTMSAVVKILENHLDLPEFTMESRFYDDYDLFNFQGLRDKYEDTNESQPLTHSSNTITTRDCSYTTSTSA